MNSSDLSVVKLSALHIKFLQTVESHMAGEATVKVRGAAEVNTRGR